MYRFIFAFIILCGRVGNSQELEVKKEVLERTTIKAMIAQMDKLARNAVKDLKAAQSTADRQIATKDSRDKIQVYLDEISGKTLEFQVKVQDVQLENEQLLVVTTLPKDLVPFATSGKALECAKYLSFHVSEDEMERFKVGKNVILQGEIMTSEPREWVDGTISTPVHLLTFSMQPALYTSRSFGMSDNEKASLWIAGVSFPDKLTPPTPPASATK